MSSRQLAQLASLTPATLSRIVSGHNEASGKSIDLLIKALDYPREFFFRESHEILPKNAINFRSLRPILAKERNMAEAASSIGILLNEWIESRFHLPQTNFPDYCFTNDPADMATTLRQLWCLGAQPITNMLKLLEKNGVRVFSLSEDTCAVDAFSFWYGNTPFIFLNQFKSAERSRFDTAHELAHLVLHKNVDVVGDREIENEANDFASNFLMPEEDMRSQVQSGKINSEYIIKAKARWRVSAMALTYRLHQLDILTSNQYKFLCMQLSCRGYRSSEPKGIARETSMIWQKVLDQLWQQKITKNSIAEDLSIPLDNVDSLICGLLDKPQPYDSDLLSSSYGSLKIVKS
ncbi:MAG: ImmA/IrrE family metallo-endopeptidase [Alphaproteobacteria bacterium]|nr:ImmA/IrrE family metallo-endopeptidase [Alphaproteobacteria bacterium]